jgi:hypothetical protein
MSIIKKNEKLPKIITDLPGVPAGRKILLHIHTACSYGKDKEMAEKIPG